MNLGEELVRSIMHSGIFHFLGRLPTMVLVLVIVVAVSLLFLLTSDNDKVVELLNKYIPSTLVENQDD